MSKSTEANHWIRLQVAIFLFACLFETVLANPAVVQEASDNPAAGRLSYQGVVLEPGDVINFHGGIFTTGHLVPGARTYGHTALYLGRDELNGEPTFLDFSAEKPRYEDDVYYGRILTEEEFLAYNAQFHPSFDVFRLADGSSLDLQRLRKEARSIAGPKIWGLGRPFGEVCSSAVASVLAKATGSDVNVTKPDEFSESPAFQRPPALIGKTISLTIVLRERMEEVLAQLNRARERESQAQAALTQSENALGLALEVRDSAAEEVARKAIAVSEKAVMTARRTRGILEARYERLRKAQETRAVLPDQEVKP